MTKLSAKSPPPALDLMLHTLETNHIRITYCSGSWKQEIRNQRAGKLEELTLLDPIAWNPEGDTHYDCCFNKADVFCIISERPGAATHSASAGV